MTEYLKKCILFNILLVVACNTFAQNTPVATNQIIDDFNLNFEKKKFQSIIDDYEKLKSEKHFSSFTNDEMVLIRYSKFYSEIFLGINQSFDDSNFNELLRSINIIEKPDDKRNYLIHVCNSISDVSQYYPEWSIKQTDKILDLKGNFDSPYWADIEYSLLSIQVYAYNRLEKYKSADEIRLKLEHLSNNPHRKLTALLEKAYYNISISQYKPAHKLLMSADSILINANSGIKALDSVWFYIVWAKLFISINDQIKARQYLSIAFDIADYNNLEESKCLILFELAVFEPNYDLKITTLENLLSDVKCDDFALKLAVLNSLAVDYGKNKLYSKAIEKLKEVYSLENKYVEKISKSTILNLAYNYEKENKFFEAEYFYSIASNDLIDKINTNFIFLSNKEKLTYWNKEKWLFNKLNYFSLQSYNYYPNYSELSFNSNIISKSLLLETSLELDQAISNSSDKLLKSQFNDMKKLRILVSKMQSEGTNKKELIEHYIHQADSLDKILVKTLGEYANAKHKFEIKWKDVQANLSTSEAAIEFARYYDDQDTIYKYMALVVRPEFEYPKLVKLGSELKIKSYCSQREFSDLYNYVWSGIDSLLTGVKTVYYSPVGELNNVPFSALINDNNYQSDSSKSNWSYLIDRYDLHQVTTTRYLADGTLKDNESIPLSINLVGGVNYSDLPLSKDSIEINETTEDLALQINLQNELNDSKTNRGGKLGYLKGSEIEVKQITKVLQDAGWLTTTISGRNAGEYQFKDELNLKSPGIIHIATHGFAFPEKEIKEEKNFQVQEKSNYKISEDPMVRCGLMFSGANISWSGDSKKMIETTGDDGILTAAEVANMDLSNTKLVVLSACETGLGKIESSEGTFGLKRGFKLAGVDQIIVSLWKVPDNETMELMTLFYSELALSKDIVSSFNKAQKEMRNRFPYEPEKWAGFVLVR